MNDADGAEYPKRIRRLRARLGLSQAKLAGLLSVSKLTVLRWERGRSHPSGLAQRRIDRAEAGWGSDAGAPAKPGTPAPLPGYLTGFIGREVEVTGIVQLLDERRLVTITGPGGAGKTRTAVEAARRWENGEARFVDLAPIPDQVLISGAVARALGVMEVPGERLLDAVIDSLQSRQVLLLLDNCEHLISGCAIVVQQFLQACPTLTVLATSREPLNVGGETVLRWSR